jgi:hypothetical protein
MPDSDSIVPGLRKQDYFCSLGSYIYPGQMLFRHFIPPFIWIHNNYFFVLLVQKMIWDIVAILKRLKIFDLKFPALGRSGLGSQ